MFDDQPIILGIIIGVSSGVVLGVLTWVGQIFRDYLRKREQVAYVRSIVVNFRDLILTSEDIDDPQLDRVLRKDEVRQAYYKDMRRLLESALRDGCSNLSYDEIQQIRSVFRTDLFPTVVLNEEEYKALFGALESIKWLRIPPISG